jgi:hypothetical protein
VPASFSVHQPNGTQIGSALPIAEGDWTHQVAEDGAASLTVKGDVVTAAQLAESVVVRINDGTRDIFGFVPTTKDRQATDNPGQSEVTLSGPGVRWLLHAGQLLQEDTSDCAEPAGTRWLGWMSAAFDDAAWSAPVSHGTYADGPFVDPRPEEWPDPEAEYIWSTTDPASPGDVYFRKTFTTDVEREVVLCMAADDEYQIFLDGTEIMTTLGGGPFQWKRMQRRPMKLCAGTHTLAIVGRNLDRVLTATNIAWVLASIMPADDSGDPIAQNQEWQVYHDRTGGTFTLTAGGQTTSALAYNASAGQVQSALAALSSVGAGNVAVNGSGSWVSPWEITFEGDLANQHVTLTGNGGSLTGGSGFHVVEWVRGSSGEAIVRTDTTWKRLAYPTDPPGLTPGEILRIAVEEVRDRGVTVLDHFDLDFTDAVDSDGVAWSSVLTVPVSLPADVHRLAVMVEEFGFGIDVTPDLELHCWNDRGSNLAGSVSLAPWTAGVSDVAATRDETAVENVIRYQAGDGWFEESDATSVSARGRWEAGLGLEGFTNRREARAIVRPLLADLATPQRSTTMTITSVGAVVPNDDFALADIVTAPAMTDTGFEQVPMRVISIGGQVNELTIDYTVELID